MSTVPLASASSRESDCRLAAAIVGGDLASWHEFILRYSPVLYHTIRKHMIAEDEDEIRSLFVEILHDLYHGRLAAFEGRASLSTWLVLVARNATFDRLRHIYGRRRDGAGWKSLSAVEREVHRLWIVEGMPFEFVRRLARRDGPPLDDQELLDAIVHIREVTGNGAGSAAIPRGAPGAPNLPREEFVAHLMRIHAELEEDASPDAQLARQELWRTIDLLAARLGRMSDSDREVLRLRFEMGLTARAIAQRVGVRAPRVVFAWVARLLRELRSDLERQVP